MTDKVLEALLAQARSWIDDDADDDTRDELEALIASNDHRELHDRFVAPLKFGTAGLRGFIGAGPNRMNRNVVARITAGLCTHLKNTVVDACERGVCIGFDGRRMSREFAREAAEVASGAGFVVHTFEAVVATPILSHAVTQLDAAAGIMVTASHNPPAYNGYKAYGQNGAQLITPDDDLVTVAAAGVASVKALPRVPFEIATQQQQVRFVDTVVVDDYYARLHSMTGALRASQAGNESSLRIAYTALHGVGDRFARRALADAGFVDVHSVADQAQPDPAFPTVAFPNPEEPGAMQCVLDLAHTAAAELVLANDPDADRLAVAARTEDGTMNVLSGNQVGLLLTDFLLRHHADPRRCCVLSSLVSTPLVARIAHAYGAHWEQTLTGTKWICNRAMELEKTRGLIFALGFEEAIGYCMGTAVRDKDGIGAAVVVAMMAAEAKSHGRTLHQELEALARQHGIAASRQLSIATDDAVSTQRLALVLQEVVVRPPLSFAGTKVERVVDLSLGESLPKTPGIVIVLGNEQRVCIRPSGTEPKVKCYVDARVEILPDERYETAQERAEHTLDAMTQALRTLLIPA